MDFLFGYILGILDAKHPRASERLANWFFDYLVLPTLGFAIAAAASMSVYDTLDFRWSWALSGFVVGSVIQFAIVVCFGRRRTRRRPNPYLAPSVKNAHR